MSEESNRNVFPVSQTDDVHASQRLFMIQREQNPVFVPRESQLSHFCAYYCITEGGIGIWGLSGAAFLFD